MQASSGAGWNTATNCDTASRARPPSYTPGVLARLWFKNCFA